MGTTFRWVLGLLEKDLGHGGASITADRKGANVVVTSCDVRFSRNLVRERRPFDDHFTAST